MMCLPTSKKEKPQDKLIERDWLENYYEQCGREIDLAFDILNANTNWAFTLISAVFTGIIVTRVFPDFWSWSLLIFASLLTVRFFVRTCLAYNNLIRWNKFRNMINELYLFTPSEKREEYRKEILKHISTYDKEWYSPLPKKSLILSNMKYGYWYLFLALGAMIIYCWFSIPKGSLVAASIQGARMIGVGILGLIGLLYEIKIFHSPRYFEYKEVEEKKRPEKSEKRRVYARELIPLTLLLIFSVSIPMMFYSESQATMLTSKSFSYLEIEYRFSHPFNVSAGETISLSWDSSTSIGFGLTTLENALEYNGTGQDLQMIEYSYGTHVSWEHVSATNSVYVLCMAGPLNEKQYVAITMRRTRVPFAQIGIYLSAIGLIITIAEVSYSIKKRH